MKSRFKNSKKEKKLLQISTLSDITSSDNDLVTRSKFNFSYLDTSQSAGFDFRDLSKEILEDILNKLREFGKKSLEELSRTPCGSGGSSGKRRCILELYGSFPPVGKTRYTEPTYIPSQVQWGRLRLSGLRRLAGFTIDPKLHGKEHSITKQLFDKNTFYIVFLDMDHNFWVPTT